MYYSSDVFLRYHSLPKTHLVERLGVEARAAQRAADVDGAVEGLVEGLERGWVYWGRGRGECGGGRRKRAARKKAAAVGTMRCAHLVQLADRRVQLLGLAVHLLLDAQLLYLLLEVCDGAGAGASGQLSAECQHQRDQLVHACVHSLRAGLLLLRYAFGII